MDVAEDENSPVGGAQSLFGIHTQIQERSLWPRQRQNKQAGHWPCLTFMKLCRRKPLCVLLGWKNLHWAILCYLTSENLHRKETLQITVELLGTT